MRHVVFASVITALTVGLLTGCTDQPATPEDANGPSPHKASTGPGPGSPEGVTVLTDNLTTPWSIAFLGQTPVISERDTARVLELDDTGESREIAVVEQTAPAGEGGLLGIAIFQNYLYAYLTTSQDNRIHRYALSGEPGMLRLGEAEVILEGIPAAGYHNGGRLAFGPDNMLYVTTGDALEPSQSQDLDSLAGKILRLTPGGEIPEDNPLEASPVYSYGHRNVQGLAWAEDGTMYASEFGENEWDELNMIEAGGNYGWPEYEGTGGEPQYIDPVQQWSPAEASPSAIEIHNGTLYMTALRGQRLWEIPLDDVGSATEHFVEEFGRLREVTTAPDGSLWILTSNTDGVGEPAENDDLLLRLEKP